MNAMPCADREAPCVMSNGLTRELSRARALPLLLLIVGLLADSQSAGAAVGGFLGPRHSDSRLLPVDPVATPQWRATLQRQAESDSRTCPAVKRCALVGWGAYLDDLSDEALRAQVRGVNFFVNQVRYREDSDVWGAHDYWATPREFFGQGGDCEDYAIAKYVALRALGVPAARLFVLVVKDQLVGSMHAVLVVDSEDGPLVLDNRSDLIVPWRDFVHYKPIYWVNEEAGWLVLGRR